MSSAPKTTNDAGNMSNSATNAGASTSNHAGKATPANQAQRYNDARPWTPQEDALLLRTMAWKCDLDEHGYKVAGFFWHRCPAYGIPQYPMRSQEATIARCERLKYEAHKYNMVLSDYEGWKKWNGGFWEDQATTSSSAQAPAANAAAETLNVHQQTNERVAEEAAEVAGVEQSIGSESEEAAQAGQSHPEQPQLQVSQSPQQQESGTNRPAPASSAVSKSNGKKRKPKLIIKASRKRLRIEVAPKGTEVVYSPKDGSVTIKL